MNRIIDLQTALLDLLQRVNDPEIRLIAGGGFGIYLKSDHVRRSGTRTLLDSEYFSSQESLGMIRLMESPYYRPELQKEEFMSALQEMFSI